MGKQRLKVGRAFREQSVMQHLIRLRGKTKSQTQAVASGRGIPFLCNVFIPNNKRPETRLNEMADV